MSEDPFKNKDLPPHLLARLRADWEKSHAEGARRVEAHARKFKFVDYVQGAHRTPGGLIANPSTDIVCIGRWQDNYGHTVYVKKVGLENYPTDDQIQTLGARIQAEQTDFQQLNPTEQSRLQAEVGPQENYSGKYGAYLTNEALEKQFQKLK